MNLTAWRTSLALVALISLGGCSRAPCEFFSKGILYEYAHDGPSIVLGQESCVDSHPVAKFYFENISGPRARAKDTVLFGVWRGGDFWPYVRCEARNDRTGAWQSLGTSWIIGWPSRLAVAAESQPAQLCVRADLFQSYAEKYEFGRIVLSSGETSEFQLKDILTPNAEQSSNQAMQLTASKPDVHAWSVCRRASTLRFMHRGLAAADLVSR